MPLTRPTTTPLPDEIYDLWAPQLGEAELKVLLYIVRRTLGFRKATDVFVKPKGNQVADRNGCHRSILVHVEGSVEIVERWASA